MSLLDFSPRIPLGTFSILLLTILFSESNLRDVEVTVTNSINQRTSFHNYTGPATNGQTLTLRRDNSVYGRYVKVQRKAQGHLVFCEIEVNGVDCSWDWKIPFQTLLNYFGKIVNTYESEITYNENVIIWNLWADCYWNVSIKCRCTKKNGIAIVYYFVPESIQTLDVQSPKKCDRNVRVSNQKGLCHRLLWLQESVLLKARTQ